jgi:hypothetical protein
VEIANERHYRLIAEKLGGGRMVPFLGAGANLCDRGDEEWAMGGTLLPSGAELARHLALRGDYPSRDERNLLRVSEYVAAARGVDELYLYLREVFDAPYEPTSLHGLLADVASALHEAGREELLVVTTNYDDLVEQALRGKSKELDPDVVWYEAREESEDFGRFIHRPPGGDPTPILDPNEYGALPETLERPAVLKLHGCLDRSKAAEDSYVVTEDSYIDYLSRGDVGLLIPIALKDRMTKDSLLFLGYSLSDWNLRVVLNRIWGGRKLKAKSWAVQREPSDPDESEVERALWDDRENIELVYCELSEYVSNLGAALASPA